MNNKGLTLIELIVTFALATVIIILLLNVLIIIKKNYEDTDSKTKLVVNQSTLSNLLNLKFSGDNLISYDECNGDFCYNFLFKDGETLILNVTDKKIVFGDYVYNLNETTYVENPVLYIDYPYLVIKIPVKTKLYPNDDFGINLVYKRE